ncbi:hypothetical protein J4O75_21190 [Paenibacillus pabuli]
MIVDDGIVSRNMLPGYIEAYGMAELGGVAEGAIARIKSLPYHEVGHSASGCPRFNPLFTVGINKQEVQNLHDITQDSDPLFLLQFPTIQ